jgi:hypothetical protein
MVSVLPPLFTLHHTSMEFSRTEIRSVRLKSPSFPETENASRAKVSFRELGSEAQHPIGFGTPGFL